jgi:hypothetical protein
MRGWAEDERTRREQDINDKVESEYPGSAFRCSRISITNPRKVWTN